jgi:hypothetical protein
MNLKQFDEIHDIIVSLVKTNEYNKLNTFMLKFIDTENRGELRTILMDLKYIKENPEISETYNKLLKIFNNGRNR